MTSTMKHDPVNHPKHYTGHPSGVECITITEHMGFCLGNAMKYIWRADLKDDAIEDLKKAAWYINREIQRRQRGAGDEKAEATSPDATPANSDHKQPCHKCGVQTGGGIGDIPFCADCYVGEVLKKTTITP